MVSRFIAHSDLSPNARNAFLLFRRRFDLGRIPAAAPFHLFADTRYRLRVNGQILGSGPTRFYPQFPEYDSYDLAPFLQVGTNEIQVEVSHRGASSFQAVPSCAGFVAWDEWDAGLETPGEWQVKLASCWESLAPTFSFAQGPVEILDVAAWEEQWNLETGWQKPVEAGNHWGELAPRSLPPLPNRILVLPETGIRIPLAHNENRVSFHRVFADVKGPGVSGSRGKFAVALQWNSPREQDVSLGVFWGDLFLNGALLERKNEASRGNFQRAEAHFQAGANLLWAEVEIVQPSWGFQISWPCESELEVRELRTGAALSDEEFATWRGEIPTSPNELARLDLQSLDNVDHCAFPAREAAWDVPSDVPAKEFVADKEPLLRQGEGAAAALFDWNRTVLGHFQLDVEVTHATTLDVALDERLRADGLLHLYGSHPFLNNVDRFVLAPGRHRIEGYHPRGGRWLQITARGEGEVRLHDVALRSAVTHLGEEGEFECSDALLNQIWRTGEATVEACWPDVWVDCPCREQGAYMGDTLVEFQAAQLLSTDRATMHRALRLWAQGQRADGQLPACVPAWYELPHADFSLIFVLALRDYWAATGDVSLIEDLWPCVERIWSSPLWQSGPDGLWDGTDDLRFFGDWSMPVEEKKGAANGALNALRIGALEATAQMAAACGRDARIWEEERQNVRLAFQKRLWRRETNDFAPFDGASEGEFANGSVAAHHANIWALRFGVADDESGVLKNVRAALQMFEAPEKLESRDGHPELYFCHYLLEALAARGLQQEGLDLVRRAWGPMLENGAVTFWERLCSRNRASGSLCHAWSCAPIWFLGREILGLRPVAGDPNRFTFAVPHIDLQWARGVVPHIKGPIRVAWRRENGEVRTEVEAPDGVTVEANSLPISTV